jgi:hypothetical protein
VRCDLPPLIQFYNTWGACYTLQAPDAPQGQVGQEVNHTSQALEGQGFESACEVLGKIKRSSCGGSSAKASGSKGSVLRFCS